jgi:hypothetical protein
MESAVYGGCLSSDELVAGIPATGTAKLLAKLSVEIGVE